MSIIKKTGISAKKLRAMKDMNNLSNLVINLENPTLNGLVMTLRDENTSSASFRETAQTIGSILAYEMGEMLDDSSLEVLTPMKQLASAQVVEEPYLVELRGAGLPLVEGARKVFPKAKSGWISFGRSGSFDIEDTKTKHYHIYTVKKDTIQPIISAYNLAGGDQKNLFLLDMVLSTGSCNSGIMNLIKYTINIDPKNIFVGNVISTHYGIEKFHGLYPDIPIFTCAIDNKLGNINHMYHGFSIPGLGDAQDRVYGR